MIEVDRGALLPVFLEADARTKRDVEVFGDLAVVASKLSLGKAAELVFREGFARLAKDPHRFVVLQIEQEQTEQQEKQRNTDDGQPWQRCHVFFEGVREESTEAHSATFSADHVPDAGVCRLSTNGRCDGARALPDLDGDTRVACERLWEAALEVRTARCRGATDMGANQAVPEEEHHGCVWKLASEAASQVVPDRHCVHDRADVATAIEDGPCRHSEDFAVVDPHVVSHEPS